MRVDRSPRYAGHPRAIHLVVQLRVTPGAQRRRRGRRRPSVALALLTAWATVVGPAALAHAARHYDPFDESKFLLPDDADSLGLEDSAALRRAAEDDDRPKPVRLMPMVMFQLAAPLADAPSVNGMVQVDTTLRHGPFGAQITPRLRFGDFAHPVGETFAMLQQAYLFFRAGGGEVKVGKVLSQFGRVWDYGLYGPLIAAADTKLVPEAGVSFELSQPLHPRFTLEVVGQYFPVDGRTFSVRNPSFFSAARARRRNVAGGRVVPVVHLGDWRLNLGLSGQHYTAVKPAPHQVWRLASDVGVDHPRFAAFAEVGRQAGEDRAPEDDAPIASYNYLWCGAEAKLDPFSVRLNANVVRYQVPYPGIDVLLQPGVEFKASEAISLALEGAFWRTNQNTLPRGERSLFAFAFFKL